MSKLKEAKRIVDQAIDLRGIIINSIQDLKGENIVQLDLRNLEEAPADYFIVCEGSSRVNIQSIAEHISKEVRKAGGERPRKIEGYRNGEWVLVDFFDVIIHVFNKKSRGFYQIEELWSDAEVTTFE